MKEYLVYWTNKGLAHVFYFMGDKICHVDSDWAYELYQKFMGASMHFDEKNGWEIWNDCQD
jgi:hypothetical protein